MLPPAVENAVVEATNLQRTPCSEGRGLFDGIHDDALRIASKPVLQRFERALFRTPKQGQKPGSLRRGRVRDPSVLLGYEIIGDKFLAARLDYLDVAPKFYPESRDRANRGAVPVAE